MPTVPPTQQHTGGSARRAVALGVALAAIALLGVAAWLRPDTAGHGTHTQLGMPKCQWVAFFDKPCLTCGMTTSFSLAADARLDRSFINQPMGAALAVVTAAVFWGCVHAGVIGVRIGPMFRGIWTRWTVGLVVVGFLGAWGYKIVTWNGV